ncbi:MAG: hypothetical protein R3C97_01800 [Geminicoccaceae bacterium]
MGAIGITVNALGEFDAAFKEAQGCGSHRAHSCQGAGARDWTEGNGSWWECGTPEVSDRPSVQQAYRDYVDGKAKQRLGV